MTGLLNLKKHVDGLARDRLVVIYCGCCPWEKCPNIAAAYKQLTEMGFTQVKVLYLASNFGAGLGGQRLSGHARRLMSRILGTALLWHWRSTPPRQPVKLPASNCPQSN
jgi:hypothetical protein